MLCGVVNVGYILDRLGSVISGGVRSLLIVNSKVTELEVR